MLNIDFKYLEFWTYYSSKGTTNKNLAREYCFSKIFYGDYKQNNDYELYIYNNGHTKNHDNNCLLTKEQLIEHIEEINKFHKFKYELKTLKNNEGYKLIFNLNAPLIYHKVILSWLRYTYEFPFNVTLYELFKVKKETGFKRITLLNLFNLIGSTMNCSKHGTSIHAIGVFYEWKILINYKEFNKLIENKRKTNASCAINCIIPTLDREDFDTLKLPVDKRINHTNYWEDEKEYKKRLKLYKNNLKILKKLNK